jgi:hypothetical protein
LATRPDSLAEKQAPHHEERRRGQNRTAVDFGLASAAGVKRRYLLGRGLQGSSATRRKRRAY